MSISEVFLGPEGRRRESGSDIQQAWDPWPSTAKDCHCLPLLGLLGEDAALRRVMEASRGQRSQLVPIWVLTVFRVFVSHATSPAVDLGGRCALGGMAFSTGPVAVQGLLTASGSDLTGRCEEMSTAEPILWATDLAFIALLRCQNLPS